MGRSVPPPEFEEIMNTAIAIDARDESGKVQPGGIAYLLSPAVPGGFLFAITNNDGYAVWPAVPVPFNGVLQLAGTIAPYGPGGNGFPVTIPANVQNVTIRVGPQAGSPQDIHLPGCTSQSFKPPFRQAPRFWKGNMAGVCCTVLPPVNVCAVDTSLGHSWIYDKYKYSHQ